MSQLEFNGMFLVANEIMNMSQLEFNGMFLVAFTSIIGIVVSITTLSSKFTTPIKNLEIAVNKLIVTLDNLEEKEKDQDNRITKHGQEIDELRGKVNDVECQLKIHTSKENGGKA